MFDLLTFDTLFFERILLELNPSQFKYYLMLVWLKKCISQEDDLVVNPRELAEKINLSPNLADAFLETLQSKGLIKLTVNPKNEKTFIIEFT